VPLITLNSHDDLVASKIKFILNFYNLTTGANLRVSQACLASTIPVIKI